MDDCACGTTTVLGKVKNHRGEPLNEDLDDLADLGRTIESQHAVWTTRSNRMVFSWTDGQKSSRTSTWNQGVRNGVILGAGRYRFEWTGLHRSITGPLLEATSEGDTGSVTRVIGVDLSDT